MEQQWNRDEVIALLVALGARLETQGKSASIQVFGGAAIAIFYDSRRMTHDVDAVVASASPLSEDATAVAVERGVHDGWLNSAGTAFLPSERNVAPDRTRQFGGLTVQFMDAATLAAMKLLAGRPIDVPDLVVLFPAAGIATAEQAVANFWAHYRRDEIVGYVPTDDDLRSDAQAILDLIPPQL